MRSFRVSRCLVRHHTFTFFNSRRSHCQTRCWEGEKTGHNLIETAPPCPSHAFWRKKRAEVIIPPPQPWRDCRQWRRNWKYYKSWMRITNNHRSKKGNLVTLLANLVSNLALSREPIESEAYSGCVSPTAKKFRGANKLPVINDLLLRWLKTCPDSNIPVSDELLRRKTIFF